MLANLYDTSYGEQMKRVGSVFNFFVAVPYIYDTWEAFYSEYSEQYCQRLQQTVFKKKEGYFLKRLKSTVLINDQWVSSSICHSSNSFTAELFVPRQVTPLFLSLFVSLPGDKREGKQHTFTPHTFLCPTQSVLTQCAVYIKKTDMCNTLGLIPLLFFFFLNLEFKTHAHTHIHTVKHTPHWI